MRTIELQPAMVMPTESKNNNLHKARAAKNDEFYTQLGDIENELGHYKRHFNGKVVYLNCDDPYESNFFKYFALNFNHLGLRKLIATSYQTSRIARQQLGVKGRGPFKIEITTVPDMNNDGCIDLVDIRLLLTYADNVVTPIRDGDFRSDECIEILQEADIVVTNPPFSLFREYVTQLADYDKKFLIIGNLNAITYRDVFKLIKGNKVWLGVKHPKTFIMSDDYPLLGSSFINKEGKKVAKFGNICWFTNLSHRKRNEELILWRAYNNADYPKYDNYDAINVDKVKDIPMDYFDVMGVPITFLEKYNPKQFEILDLNPHFFEMVAQGLPKPSQLRIKGQKDPYARILIKRRTS